ncbi:hypothetical protein QE152_g3843 [Popillia japonica]|uniref:Uncharacterized protein n=1 Tax=Popillia japonica TaxID=7064 RepID=A0AAW1N2K4_POPJA
MKHEESVYRKRQPTKGSINLRDYISEMVYVSDEVMANVTDNSDSSGNCYDPAANHRNYICPTDLKHVPTDKVRRCDTFEIKFYLDYIV